MVPDVKGADAILRMYNDARSGKQQFPYIKELLDMICPETIPIKVSGDIHYGLNKTKTGWWIYLLNNKGVYRLYGDPEKLDPKRAAEVTIDISMLNPQKVTELFTNTDIIRKDGKVALVVPPGDIRCLRVDCAK
jgi:hypothetical protein